MTRRHWHAEVEDDGPDPIHDPGTLPEQGARALVACAHRGCAVRVQRVGGMWFHVGAAGDHRPRPAVDQAVNHG